MSNEPIQVFVGCAPNGEDAESLMVLEYSMRKHTNRFVKLNWMHHGADASWSGWDSSSWATPFSGFRWSIPEHMQFKGQGIYMDSDMVILSDIGNLWDDPFEKGKVVIAKGASGAWRYCVCKWNNEAAKNHIMPLDRMKQLPNAHQRMMSYFSGHQNIVQPFKGNWNCIDGENKKIEEIDILHYSDMSSQFHQKYAFPRLAKEGRKHWFDGKTRKHWRQDLIDLFDQYYNEALAAGFTVESYVPGTDQFIEYKKYTQKDYDNYRNEWSR